MEPARGGPDPRGTACRPIRGFGEIPRIRWRFQGRNAVNDGSVHRRGVRSRDRCIRVPEREDDFTVPTTRLLRRTGTATSRWTWWILSAPVRARRSRDAGRGAQRDELLRILRRRHRESDACAARRVFPRRRDPGRAPRGPAGRSLHARLRESADRRLRTASGHRFSKAISGTCGTSSDFGDDGLRSRPPRRRARPACGPESREEARSGTRPVSGATKRFGPPGRCPEIHNVSTPSCPVSGAALSL